MRNNEESRVQRACVAWFKYQFPDVLIMSLPNGGYRNKIEAGILKAEGVLAGASDLLIAKPSNGYCGLWIEMKVEKGKQSPAQKEFEKNATRNGYKYVVCRSLEQFIYEVKEYLKYKQL